MSLLLLLRPHSSGPSTPTAVTALKFASMTERSYATTGERTWATTREQT